MTNFKTALSAGCLLLATAGLAGAQTAATPAVPTPVQAAQTGPTYDPAQLPSAKGVVAQYLLSPRGEIEGLLLADGTEVHINPMLSTELAFSVKPGDSVTIRGLKAKNSPMIAAAAITNDASGATVAGRMGHGMHERGANIEAEGTVKAALHEPRGEINGVLLDNGTVVRLPPSEAKKFAAQLAVGQPLYVRGMGVTSPLGKVVLARQIGADRTKLADVAMPRMHGPDGKMHGMMGGHGPMGAKPPSDN